MTVPTANRVTSELRHLVFLAETNQSSVFPGLGTPTHTQLEVRAKFRHVCSSNNTNSAYDYDFIPFIIQVHLVLSRHQTATSCVAAKYGKSGIYSFKIDGLQRASDPSAIVELWFDNAWN